MGTECVLDLAKDQFFEGFCLPQHRKIKSQRKTYNSKIAPLLPAETQRLKIEFGLEDVCVRSAARDSIDEHL